MKTSDDLRSLLERIDHKGYPAYKDTRGSYRFGGYTLHIDHVQGDPFASPSKVSISISGRNAGFPSRLFDLPHKRIALQDYLTRVFGGKLESYNFKAKGSGKADSFPSADADRRFWNGPPCPSIPSPVISLSILRSAFPPEAGPSPLLS